MKVHIVAVGKIKEKHVRRAIDDYVERIAHYASYKETEIDDADDAGLLATLERLRRGESLVGLDSRGSELDSRGFASFIEKLGRTNKGDVMLAIGGRDGLGPKTLAACDHRLSLSKMTFPHRLARLILVEQVYRAFSLIRGEPYGM